MERKTDKLRSLLIHNSIVAGKEKEGHKFKPIRKFPSCGKILQIIQNMRLKIPNCSAN